MSLRLSLTNNTHGFFWFIIFNSAFRTILRIMWNWLGFINGLCENMCSVLERKVQDSQRKHIPFCSFWEEAECSKTSPHKYSIHYRRKQHPSFFEMGVVVQCDTPSIFKMLCIIVYLKKQCTSHWSSHFTLI